MSSVWLYVQNDLLSSALVAVCVIAVLGYLVGSIKICGIELGTSGVLMVALVFGHLEIAVPSIFKDIGLACFVSAVGFIAGPTFFKNFKHNAKSYISLGIVIILSSSAVCAAIIILFGISKDICVGLLAGALTSTPGLAAALEATGSESAAIGYGVAYPFGVISVVIFVQLMPKLLGLDVASERAKYAPSTHIGGGRQGVAGVHHIDELGFFSFFLAVLLGSLIGKINIPLVGGTSFSLGTSGGALLMGLLIGHFQRIGSIGLHVNEHLLTVMREFGLTMFLIGAGTEAGGGFMQVLKDEGMILFVYGAVMAIVPMAIGFLLAYKIMRLNIFDSLGAICGGMTSTPALGTLINTSGTDGVITAYAATYPVALVVVVLVSQFICKFL